MTPTHFIPSAAIAALFATGVAAQDRTYDLSGFDRVEVSAGVTTKITTGADFSITAEAIRGDIERLEIDLLSGTLAISRKSTWSLFGWGREDRFVVMVTMPDLTGVESTSGATVDVSNVSATTFDAEATSGATLVLDNADLGAVTLAATSGATLRIAGACEGLDALASSGASLIADDLRCATVDAESSSGASMHVHATAMANLHASSGASLAISGDGEIEEQETSSGGSISRR